MLVVIEKLIVNGVELEFQFDTGAAIYIMSAKQRKKIGKPNLKQLNIVPTNYDGSKIKIHGRTHLIIMDLSRLFLNNKLRHLQAIQVGGVLPYIHLERPIRRKSSSCERVH